MGVAGIIETCHHCGAVIPQPADASRYDLTHTEFRIYWYILKHPHCEGNHIAVAIYGRELTGHSNVVQVHVCNIRRKLAKHGLLLQASARGPGATYRIVKEQQDAPT